MGVQGTDSNICTIRAEKCHRIRPISHPQNVVQSGALQECGGSGDGASGTGRGMDVRVTQHPGKKSTERRRRKSGVRRRGGEEEEEMLNLEAGASGKESPDSSISARQLA